MNDGIVQFAGKRKRPEIDTKGRDTGGIGGRRLGRAVEGEIRQFQRAVDVDGDVIVDDLVGTILDLERRQNHTLCIGRAVGLGGEFPGARRHRIIELGPRHQFVDQIPVDGPLAAHAFRGGAEHVGAIVPHLALVHQAGQSAGPRQHREKRQFGQGHGRGAIIDQHDVIGRQRQLIPAAGRGAVDGADEFLA